MAMQTMVADCRLAVTLKTADGCEGKFAVELKESGPSISNITWSPEEPDDQTESVTFDLFKGDELAESYVINGDFWRELEDGDYEDELFEIILADGAVESAFDSMPVLGVTRRM